jgi:hypothetical protein
MNSIRFPARLIRLGRSWAVSRTTVRRRLAAGSVALAAVLAGLAFTAGPAHASSTGYCLLAVGSYEFNPIVQYQCDDSDNYENWTVTQAAVPNGDTPPPDYGGLLVQFRNNGASSYCLDANATQIQDFGQIIEWGCDSNDPYQLWIPIATSGAEAFENYGAWLINGASYCLDADAQQTNDFGPVIQWQCNSSDPYQLWFPVASDYHVLQNVGASA